MERERAWHTCVVVVSLPPTTPPLSILIGKKANNTNATWAKMQVVDTWLNKTYLPKANNTSPLAGAGSIANQKLTNAALTTSYVYNATAAKLVNAVAAKSNLTR